MSGGLSRARLGRMHDVMAGHVERGEAPGLLSPAQKAVSAMVPGEFDSRGWGFGVGIVTRRDAGSDVPGRFGWDGGYGTSWASDPREGMVAILMTQRLGFPLFSKVYLDFWTSAYQAIDD